MEYDLTTVEYQVQLRPGPRFLVCCTILANILFSMFFLWITWEVSFPAFPSSPVPEAEMTSVEGTDILETNSGQDQAFSNVQLAEEGADAFVSCAVNDRFPPAILQWCGLITHYANKHGLPPDLVAALIWQESGGNPSAYSRSGAVGLMQVMPSDGLATSFMCVNGPCFSNRPTTQQLQDPEYNIAYGTKLLAGLLQRYGNLREALKFYGPMDMGYYYADKVFNIFHKYGNNSP